MGGEAAEGEPGPEARPTPREPSLLRRTVRYVALVAILAAIGGAVGGIIASQRDGEESAEEPGALFAPAAASPTPSRAPEPSSTATRALVRAPAIALPTAPPVPTAAPSTPTPTQTASPTPSSATFGETHIKAAFSALPGNLLKVDPAQLGITIEEFGEPFSEIVSFASAQPFEFIVGVTGSLRKVALLHSKGQSAPGVTLDQFVDLTIAALKARLSGFEVVERTEQTIPIGIGRGIILDYGFNDQLGRSWKARAFLSLQGELASQTGFMVELLALETSFADHQPVFEEAWVSVKVLPKGA